MKTVTADYFSFLQDIYSKVVFAINDFYLDYGKAPHYLIISEATYSLLKSQIYLYMKQDNTMEKYCGLTICVSPAIEDYEVAVY